MKQIKLKKRFTPVYKKLILLKINALLNFKILKFKRKKWSNFIFFFKNSCLKTKYKKFKFIDQTKIVLNKKNRLQLNYKQKYKQKFITFKVFNIFFGQLKKKYYKNLSIKIHNQLKTKISKSKSLFFLKKLEKRLDFILWQSKFCSSLKMARQIIFHKHVKVNSNVIINKSYILKSGDLISVNFKKYANDKHLNFPIWPVSPNFLVINYQSMEIVFLSNYLSENNSSMLYPFNLSLKNNFD